MESITREDGKITPKIFHGQTRFCFDVFPVTGMMLLIGSIVIGFLLWEEVGKLEAGYWLAASAVIIIARFALHYAYKNLGDLETISIWWYSAFLMGTLASAMILGFAGLVFFPHLKITSQMIFVLMVIGVVSSALPMLAADLKYYFAYVLLNIGPIAAVYLMSDSAAIKLVGILTFVFIGMLMLSGYLFSRTLLNSLVYRYKSEILTERLQSANNRLSSINQELQEISTTDELTGAYNRRYFNLRFEEVWADHLREKQKLAALMIDVDHFKAYNDHFGHLQGDVCLKRLAQEIIGVIRRPRDFVARFGGEEFIMLLPNTDIDGAQEIAERIHARVEILAMPHKRQDEGATRVTVSVGGSVFLPTDMRQANKFLEQVDQALYQAKINGRNRTVFL